MPRERVRLPNTKRLWFRRKSQWDAVIGKWDKIIEILKGRKEPTNVSNDSCAFCSTIRHYYLGCTKHCPITKDGNYGCSGTPYSKFARALDMGHYIVALKHARAMRKYLLQLREKDEWRKKK